MTLTDLMALSAEDFVEVAYLHWLESDHCATVSYMDLVPEGPEDDCAEVTERGLLDWFHEWVATRPDEDEYYADGFTMYEQNRINGLADQFVYAAIDGVELAEEYASTLRSLPR